MLQFGFIFWCVIVNFFPPPASIYAEQFFKSVKSVIGLPILFTIYINFSKFSKSVIGKSLLEKATYPIRSAALYIIANLHLPYSLEPGMYCWVRTAAVSMMAILSTVVVQVAVKCLLLSHCCMGECCSPQHPGRMQSILAE